MGQIHVMTGVERRRRWSDDQKRAIVAAAFAPGAVVADVARRADVNSGQVYRWRQDLRTAARGFAEVVVTSGPPGVPGSGDAAIEVAVGRDIHVRFSAATPPALAAAVVGILVRR
jgi:transposase